jgi:hypothetical protein
VLQQCSAWQKRSAVLFDQIDKPFLDACQIRKHQFQSPLCTEHQSRVDDILAGRSHVHVFCRVRIHRCYPFTDCFYQRYRGVPIPFGGAKKVVNIKKLHRAAVSNDRRGFFGDQSQIGLRCGQCRLEPQHRIDQSFVREKRVDWRRGK